MFVVATYVAPSSIHGLGVFAGENLVEGQILWHFAPGLDQLIPFEAIAIFPQAFRAYLDMYAYISPQVPGGMILSCDHAKFLNHSDDANTRIEADVTRACRAIPKDAEITCDYRICCADWSEDFFTRAPKIEG